MALRTRWAFTDVRVVGRLPIPEGSRSSLASWPRVVCGKRIGRCFRTMVNDDLAKNVLDAVFAAINVPGIDSDIECRRVCIELTGVAGSKHIHHENEKVHKDDVVLTVTIRAKVR